MCSFIFSIKILKPDSVSRVLTYGGILLLYNVVNVTVIGVTKK